jgi:hypothetical protein
MSEEKRKRLRCPKLECSGNGEYQYLGEEKSITIVNEEGRIVYNAGTYIYKCMSCSITFKSDISPQIRKVLHG